MKVIYPVVTRHPFHTEKGKFYHCANPEEGIWKRIECYMPGSPSTYNCDTMEQVADKLLDRLISGDIRVKNGLSGNGSTSSSQYALKSGSMVITNSPQERLSKPVANAL